MWSHDHNDALHNDITVGYIMTVKLKVFRQRVVSTKEAPIGHRHQHSIARHILWSSEVGLFTRCAVAVQNVHQEKRTRTFMHHRTQTLTCLTEALVYLL